MLGPTTDHEEIRRWANTVGAKPAEVSPNIFDGEPAILRFVFGSVLAGAEFRVISWDNFFALFDAMGLALVYDESPQYQLLQVEEKSAYRFMGKPL